jgi:hypothetical protein
VNRRIRNKIDGWRASSTSSTPSLAVSTRGSAAHLGSGNDRRRGRTGLLMTARQMVVVGEAEVDAIVGFV